MKIDIDELEARAKAATRGPWLIERRDMGSGEIIHVVYGAHDVTWSGDEACPNARGDARYIAAASPDVVLALIARVRELEAALAAEREAHHKALDAYATLLREVDAERARADAGASACEVGLRNQLGLERELTAARADLAAAEREADRWRHGLPVEGDYVCPAAQERDAAIARADAAERERDDLRTQAEASLVVPCACGRPMPSVSSRLRCDACRAEGERDEARAAVVAMRAVLADIAEDYGIPYDDQLCDAPKRATEALEASDAGAPLLAELRALRAVRDRVGAVLVAAGCSCDCGHDSEGHDDDCDRCVACLVQGALDAAKGGG